MSMTTPTQKPESLLPCPFCGGEAVLMSIGRCRCPNSKCPIFQEFSIREWNTRAGLWVKCSERLPEVIDEYLTVVAGEVTTMAYAPPDPENDFEGSWEYPNPGPTHWQPFPTPPQPPTESE